MSAPIEELHKEVFFVKDTARLNNWEKRVELMALDLLFRSGYYRTVSKPPQEKE